MLKADYQKLAIQQKQIYPKHTDGKENVKNVMVSCLNFHHETKGKNWQVEIGDNEFLILASGF